MDTIYESASNFIKLTNTKYHFVFTQNRKRHDIYLDFFPSDYRHASGLHYIDDIVIEYNPDKLITSILTETEKKLTDEKLNQSKKYKEKNKRIGSINQRVSDIRWLEQCLDSSEFLRLYQVQPYGSQIRADYFIEAKCNSANANMYIFIRQRTESANYVVVSFFRKSAVFIGSNTNWLLKEKITDNNVIELYRNSHFK